MKTIPCEIGLLPIQHINLDKNPLPANINKKQQKGNLQLLKHLQKGMRLGREEGRGKGKGGKGREVAKGRVKGKININMFFSFSF